MSDWKPPPPIVAQKQKKTCIRPDRYDDETMNVKTTVSDTKPNQHSKVIEIYKKSYGDNWEKMLRARMDKKGVDPAIYGL